MARAGEIVAFDVETTGLSPHRGHRVIEIGAVRVVNGAFTEEFHSLIDCGGSISMSAQRIHGIPPSPGGVPRTRGDEPNLGPSRDVVDYYEY